jgi:antitoxin ChpS
MSRLRTVGGSVMFAIPKAILEGLHLQLNASVGVSLTAGKPIIDPHPRRRYLLTEMIAQCDPEGMPTEEDLAWVNDAPIGREQI